MTDIRYIKHDEPYKVGEYRGDDIVCFGAYRVQLDDGFVVLSPHSSFIGKVGAVPLPLDDEDVQSMLVHFAEETRTQFLAERGGGRPPS